MQARIPRAIFETNGVVDVNKLNRFKSAAASSIAEHLSCLDYDGEPMVLTPGEVDIHVMPYDLESLYVDFGGPFIQVQILGSDYPSRMDGLEGKLTKIAEDLKEALTSDGYTHLYWPDKPIGVTFLAIPKGGYISL